MVIQQDSDGKYKRPQPARIIYNGNSSRYFWHYYNSFTPQEHKAAPLILTESLDIAIQSAYQKAKYDESLLTLAIIDSKKLGNLLEFDNGWKTRELPLDCYGLIQLYDYEIKEGWVKARREFIEDCLPDASKGEMITNIKELTPDIPSYLIPKDKSD